MISPFHFLTERTIVAIAWAVLSLFLWIVLSVYLVGEVRNEGRYWYDRLGNKAAVAIWVYMLGETISRMWGAVLTAAVLSGADSGEIENRYPIALVGACVALVGILCKVRIFTPKGWGEWLWLGVGVAGVGIALVVAAVVS